MTALSADARHEHPAPRPPLERLSALDALRGLMALAVAVYHFNVWTHVLRPGSRLASNVIVAGIFSVQGFFVISGFCFFYLYAGQTFSRAELRTFHIKRFFRIAPLYYLALLLDIALGQATGPLTPTRIVENVTLSFGLFHPNHSRVLGGWSIGVEYVFYLAFPLLLWIVRWPFGMLMLLVVLTLVALPYNFVWVPEAPELARFNNYVQVGNHAFLFIVGGLFAALRKRTQQRLLAWQMWLLALLTVLLFQAWLTPFYDHFEVMKGNARVICLFACCALVLAFGLARSHSSPLMRLLTVLGDLSYAVYLLHPFAWLAVSSLLPGKEHALLVFWLGLLSTLLLAALVHYRFERPLLRLGRKLAEQPARATVVAPIVVTTALLALTPQRASADPFHFQGIPLGQRALGFGGAFTGLADDPSAAYYNPAGLVRAGDTALSASFTINAFDHRTIGRGYRTDLGTRTLRHSSDPSLPGSVAVLKRIGKKQRDGQRNHAIGLSTFTVDQRSLSFDTEVRDVPRTGIATLSVDSSTRTVWNGFSYAYRLDEKWSLGATGFFSTTRTSYRDELIASDLGALLANDQRFESNAGTWNSHRTRSDVKNLLGRLGVLYRHDQKLQIGLMFQPPSIHVRGKADVRQRELDIDRTEGSGSFLTVSQKSLASYNPMPWELRLGMSYRFNDRFMISADSSLYGSNGSRRDPVVQVGKRSPNPETGAVADVGYFEVDRWYRPVSGNFALGGEAVVWDVVALRAGLFTSLSAAPSLPLNSRVYLPADIHRFGGAFSVGIDAAGFDVSLGLTGLFGKGEALALDTRADADALYRRTAVRDATLFIFVTGIRNVVANLAKKADEKLQEMLKARALEAEHQRAADEKADKKRLEQLRKLEP